MNTFIILLIVLLSALIINEFFNNYFNVIEGHTNTIVEKCNCPKCPKCDSEKAKDSASKNNGVYKTLQGDFKDLSLQLNLVKDANKELDHQLKSNKVGTENSVEKAKVSAQQVDKEREAGLKGLD